MTEFDLKAINGRQSQRNQTIPGGVTDWAVMLKEAESDLEAAIEHIEESAKWQTAVGTRLMWSDELKAKNKQIEELQLHLEKTSMRKAICHEEDCEKCDELMAEVFGD